MVSLKAVTIHLDGQPIKIIKAHQDGDMLYAQCESIPPGARKGGYAIRYLEFTHYLRGRFGARVCLISRRGHLLTFQRIEPFAKI